MTAPHGPGLRLAVYGDIDFNIVDGSSVWLSSVIQTLSRHPSIHLTVLLKTPVRRDLLTKPLESLTNVELVEPPPAARGRRLSPADAVAALRAMDERAPFHRILLRGFALCREAAKVPELGQRLWMYLTDIPQSAEALTPESLQELEVTVEACEYVLCQTESFRGFLESFVVSSRRKALLLPPMIPPPESTEPRPRTGITKIVYAGKFAPAWGTLEMIDAFRRLRESRPGLELHVIGDKIHDPPEDPRFKSRVQSALTKTPGLIWHQALARSEVQAALGDADLAWAWRRPELDQSLELSTKLLEYGAAGLPIVLNRNPSNESLLGSAYPLYAASIDDAVDVARNAADDPRILNEAAALARSKCDAFTFDNVYEQNLRPYLQRTEGKRPRSGRRRTILVAGHDLRFIRDILAQLERDGHEILVDKWRGHSSHDLQHSKRLLEKADLVICEWCLGNAVWYTKHLHEGQDLIIRLHLQEIDTVHPKRVAFERVKRVIFVGPYLLEKTHALTDWPTDRLVSIPNYVDTRQFERPKLDGSVFNLGMVGFCPARKRLDRALDILELLRAEDSRFCLFVKGMMPWDYDWLWKRKAERAYYERVFDRIRSSPLLRDSVVFDAYGDDVAAWFRKIGFVLSPSDFESFHVAVPEGAASRAIPVIHSWKGAERLYPSSWIHSTSGDAAAYILDCIGRNDPNTVRSACHAYAEEHFSVDRVMDVWREIVDDPAGSGSVSSN